ncbi:MAG: hypothetical protein V1912_05490 [bacterium]
MSEVQVSCATCRFWEEQSNRCHRYAPSPTLGNGEYSDGRQNASWALTNAEDWCGDYESTWEEEDEEEEKREEAQDEEAQDEEAQDEEWDADGTLKWSPPPAAPPAQRGLFR